MDELKSLSLSLKLKGDLLLPVEKFLHELETVKYDGKCRNVSADVR